MKVIITRTKEDSEISEARLKELGFECLSFPCIDIIEPSDGYQALDREIRNNHLYDWVFFLSRNAADAFFTRLLAIGGHFFNLPPHLKIGVIGPSSLEFVEQQVNFPVDFMPTVFTSKDFAMQFLEKYSQKDFISGSDKKRILLVRAELEDREFEDLIEDSGQFEITTVHGYKTVKNNNNNLNDFIDFVANEDLVYLLFASSKTVKYFKEIIEPSQFESWSKLKILSIGPRTTEAIKTELRAYLNPEYILEARSASFESLVELLRKLL